MSPLLSIARLAVVTSLVASFGCSVDPVDPPTDDDIIIDANDARAIATGFLHAQVEVGHRTEWHGAVIGDPIAYYDSHGELQAYEAAVRGPAGVPAGWIMVEAWNELPPISAYAPAGSSNYVSLLAQAEVELGGAPPSGSTLTPLWVGSASAALDVRWPDGKVDRIAPTPELEHREYSGRVRRQTLRELPVDPADPMSREARYAHLRAQYRAGTLDDTMRGTHRAVTRGQVAGTVGLGAGEFSHYDQEVRDWVYPTTGQSYCATGCSPVAFAILTDYWDRHGYPSLVGNVDDNANIDHTDDDVRWMMDQYRGRMYTECVDGEGGTSFLNYQYAGDHINSRFAGRWTTDNTRTQAWSWIKDEIDAGRPAVVHYNESRSGILPTHSAVAYEYTDNFGVGDDWICAEKGWGWFEPSQGASLITWDCFPVATAGWVQATRIIPPNLPAPAGVVATDGQFTDRVRITWQPAAGATGYTIHRTTGPHPSVWPEGPDRQMLASGLTATSFEDTTAMPGTNYYYWVGATRGGEVSAFSPYDRGARAVTTSVARVQVSGIQPVLGQHVCAAGPALSARRATAVDATSYHADIPTPSRPADVDVVFFASSSPTCSGGWLADYWPGAVTYRLNGIAIDRCVPRSENSDWNYVRGTITVGGAVTNSGTRPCPGGPIAPSTTAQVRVTGATTATGEYVCAAGNGHAARRAAAIGADVHEATFWVAAPTNLDTVFYVSSSATCAGGWLRDLWPGAVSYAVDGVAVTRCVPRPENSDWSYVRGAISAAGAVTDTGTRACPGGSVSPTTTARVRVTGATTATGEYVCAAGNGHAARRATAVGGGVHDATFTIARPTNLDTVFYVSSSVTCAGGWLRDLWPGAVSYAVDGVAITRCVPRPENSDWNYVRGAIGATGAVTDAGIRACPSASAAWSAIAAGTTYSGSVSAGAERRYSFTRLNGRTYTVTLHPTSGDPDLFTSKFSTMTRTDAQCSSTRGAGLDDVCSFTANDSGTNYVIVFGYSAADYTLRVNEN